MTTEDMLSFIIFWFIMAAIVTFLRGVFYKELEEKEYSAVGALWAWPLDVLNVILRIAIKLRNRKWS